MPLLTPILNTFVVVLLCSLFAALPPSNRWWAKTIRFLALVAIVAAPLYWMWHWEKNLASAGALILSVILSSASALLLTLGWLSLFPWIANPEDHLSIPLFDPFVGNEVSTAHGADQAASQFFGGLLGMLVFGILLLGVLSAVVLVEYAMPKQTSWTRRLIRAGLSFIYGGVFLAILLGAVLPGKGTAAAPTSQSTVLREEIIDIDSLETRVAALMKSLNAGTQMMWSSAITPAFPLTWPPSHSTIWVRYAYARGQEFPPGRLADGEHVSKAWLRIELHPDIKKARLVPLSSKLEEAGIQGIRPLLPAESEILFKNKKLQDYATSLKSSPSPNDAQAVALKKFYQLWLQTQGVIAAQIRVYHPAFFQWVES